MIVINRKKGVPIQFKYGWAFMTSINKEIDCYHSWQVTVELILCKILKMQ